MTSPRRVTTDVVIDDFVSAVNEVVAAVIANSESASPSIDVRWVRRAHPRSELYAEIRNAAATPTSLLGDGIVSRILHHAAERIDVEERIGGSLITLRSRI